MVGKEGGWARVKNIKSLNKEIFMSKKEEEEKIKKAAILSKVVGICPVIHRTFLIPRNQDQSLTHLSTQHFSPLPVNLFCKHISICFSLGIFLKIKSSSNF